MQTYSAPLRDMRFVLNELLDVGTLATLPGYEEATPDVIDAVIEEGAKLCENTLLPLNRSADEEGCHYENGAVRTPRGFKEAYRRFVEAGWAGVTVAPDYGGQGLPELVGVVFDEMVCSTNLAFGVYPLLSKGAAALIGAHATDDLKEAYLPRLADGTWSGTMCLTEPHCGTDLGQIRTRATPIGDDRYAITGTKIFISAGEHDLTENIVHLVLARLPDAPAGVRGISLFLVPKRRTNPDGTAGPANGVRCGSIEKKMGIHGSATCVMHFEEAEGLPDRCAAPGAPLHVHHDERRPARGRAAGPRARRDRLSERCFLRAGTPPGALAEGRRRSGGGRRSDRRPSRCPADAAECPRPQRGRPGAGLLGRAPARHLPPPSRCEIVRGDADELVQLMTPIVKAFFTDYGFEATNLAVQVHGGHGYIREHGMEQLVRDARIGQIYEGANGIQALDLVGRKLPQRAGRFLRHFFHPAIAFVEENPGGPGAHRHRRSARKGA